jgi:hypothetical protein
MAARPQTASRPSSRSHGMQRPVTPSDAEDGIAAIAAGRVSWAQRCLATPHTRWCYCHPQRRVMYSARDTALACCTDPEARLGSGSTNALRRTESPSSTPTRLAPPRCPWRGRSARARFPALRASSAGPPEPSKPGGLLKSPRLANPRVNIPYPRRTGPFVELRFGFPETAVPETATELSSTKTPSCPTRIPLRAGTAGACTLDSSLQYAVSHPLRERIARARARTHLLRFMLAQAVSCEPR